MGFEGMNSIWNSHAQIGRIALRALPEWELNLLHFPPSGPELKFFPACSSGAEQLAASCLIMDWVYDPVFRPYGVQPCGMQLPHMLPDDAGKGAFFSGNPPSPGKFAELLTWQMERTLQALREKKWLEFFRFAGVLGHFLQDVTAPTHTVTPALLRSLFPDPVPGHLAGLGGCCYRIAEDITIEPARLAGRNIPHAVFRITQEAFAAAERARKLLPQLLKHAYGNEPEKCSELLKGPVRDAARLTADVWHTLFSIEAGRCGGLPDSMPLTDLAPLYHHPDLYAYAGPGVFCRNGGLVPLDVIAAGGPARYERGFGMTGYSGMKFFLNGIFHRLDFSLGMADWPDSRNERIDLDFTVETAPGWNTVFSEDMEYGTQPVLKIHLGPGETVRTFQADITGAGTLVLACRAKPYRTETGSVSFAIPHIAVLNPMLS